MFAFLTKLVLVVRSRLKSRARLEAEILVLRQQVIVLSRKSGSRVWLRNIDRLIFVWIYRLFPSILNGITVVKPETVIRWHRRGCRAYWRWKSRRRGGRPRIDCQIRDLIRRISKENPLWGAPRIHGELLMLGIAVAESTVARYMTRQQGPPSQGWKTFLRNHAAGIASIDLFVVRTMSFKLLYGLVILRHARRRLVTISVTNNPTAEWIAGQVTDAFPWDEAPRHLIRDRDGAYGPAYTHRIRAMGIRDRPTAPRSPWQNGHVERLIGSIRRESLDHLIVFGEAHLRAVLKAYASYYNEVRTHLSLNKDAPDFRRTQKIGRIAATMRLREEEWLKRVGTPARLALNQEGVAAGMVAIHEAIKAIRPGSDYSVMNYYGYEGGAPLLKASNAIRGEVFTTILEQLNRGKIREYKRILCFDHDVLANDHELKSGILRVGEGPGTIEKTMGEHCRLMMETKGCSLYVAPAVLRSLVVLCGPDQASISVETTGQGGGPAIAGNMLFSDPPNGETHRAVPTNGARDRKTHGRSAQDCLSRRRGANGGSGSSLTY